MGRKPAADRTIEPDALPDSILPLMQLSAAAVGLLAFAAMILRGMSVDNPFDVVLGRAITGLVAGTLIGSVAGRLAQAVLNDKRATLASPPATETGENTERTAAGSA